MLRSPGSPLDPHDAHLRHLLDQRATRADLHSRIGDDGPDTPSLYSHAFSPRPNARLDLDDASSFHGSPASIRTYSNSRPDRNRLNDLAVSMLDMDEDRRSSYASTTYDEDDRHSSPETVQEGLDDTMPRMSYLGPKMRFHSKAPWELEDSPFPEEDDYDQGADEQSVMSSALQSIGITPRRLVFGGTKSGHEGRTSGESSRSGGTEKTSLDSGSQISYPHPPFHDRAQASMSSTSLVGQSVPRKPIPKFYPDHRSPSSPISPSSPHYTNFSDDYSSRGSEDNDSKLDTHHPYANPNFARTSEDKHSTTNTSMPRSDSTATVTRSQKSIASLKSPGRQPALIPAPQSPRLPAYGKEISSPISVRSTSIRSGEMPENVGIITAPPPQPNGISGWTEQAASPGFNLITLEEARAQRSRAATIQPTASSTALAHPFLEETSSYQNPVGTRARARSISAGTKAKHALSSIVGSGIPSRADKRDTESVNGQSPAINGVTGKSLKHKKSGFMRLFNGTRDESPPPPVPSLSEGYAVFNAQQSAPRNPISSHRIPIPQISPSLLEEHRLGEEPEARKPLTGPKRTPPPLNLSTSAHTPGLLRPYISDIPSQSAPANVTEFPSLKLRPVSTMFSAQFGDHILTSPSSTNGDIDTPSSLSASTAVSPLTPGPFFRSEDSDKKFLTAGATDDSVAVIKSLREQIATSRHAWQQQVWELEGQIRDLKAEVEELRSSKDGPRCEHCGKQTDAGEADDKKAAGVVNRPRARTGTALTRFGGNL
ncbi:hypothetical protein K435DRAFT_833501 [Dendrothele bispora CBS 962.96]|uniref:Uncharacterized protein n=1 Tax=Dendrothele bispora (strain CBS 962.96) TaxID=1314807 RepID=A0A4S8MX47_DENBC|nr:hypothetical protein K435DRAFT_833501 [Dendrothele bispora CBS 962.96]